jgi:transporter family protein
VLAVIHDSGPGGPGSFKKKCAFRPDEVIRKPSGARSIELWFILSSVVVLFWGSAGILAKLSTPRLGVRRIAVLIALVEGPLYAAAFFIWRADISMSISTMMLALFSCVVGVVGYLCFFESIMEGQVAIAGTISAAYPALTVIGALAILGETLTTAQALGVLGIIAGVVALSYEPSPESKHATNKRSLLFAFLAFGFWGLWSLTSKMAVDRVESGNVFGFYVISSMLAPVLFVSFRMVRPKGIGGLEGDNPTRTAWILGALALAINTTGTFAYTYALQGGSASLVVPISSAYPLVTVVMAVAFLREKLNRYNLVALAVVVVGLVMVGLTV